MELFFRENDKENRNHRNLVLLFGKNTIMIIKSTSSLEKV